MLKTNHLNETSNQTNDFKSQFKAGFSRLWSKIQANPTLNRLVRPSMPPKLQQFIKTFVPILIIFFILFSGFSLGKAIYLRLKKPTLQLPIPTISPLSPTPTIKSELLPLKRSLEKFNTQLPDPVMPVFDDEISIEELEED